MTTPEPALPLSGVRRSIWDAMWAQPVATLWNLIDLAPLTRLVILQTSPDAMLDRGLLAEMRQLEDRFLLSPYARAQQRVADSDAKASSVLAEEFAKGSREGLLAMRDSLLVALDAADPSVAAQIAGQVRLLAKDIAALPQDVERTKADELRARREARGAGAADRAPAARRRKSRAG